MSRPFSCDLIPPRLSVTGMDLLGGVIVEAADEPGIYCSGGVISTINAHSLW